MTKEQLIHQLQLNHASLISTIASLTETEFNLSRNGKWNAGENLDHIYRAVSTLSLGMKLPKFIFAILFGKSRRGAKTYDELVSDYKEILAKGAKAHGRYLPGGVSFIEQKKKASALTSAVNNICKVVGYYAEEDLDAYRLPHPLLGKLSIREMLYFTIYHAEHHMKNVLRDAKAV